MGVDISGGDDAVTLIARVRGSARDPVRLNRIVVIGGGCYGSWYTGQLTLATRRGALAAQQIVVVDKDSGCLVAQRRDAGAYEGAPVSLVVATWEAYLAEWLDRDRADLANDAMVPSPLMPHLCLDWLMSRARRRWPDRSVRVVPLPSTPPMPWERSAPDGRHYVSYATWTCPVNCIEPARCPATKGPRTWSMPPALEQYVAATPELCGSVIFHCVHRTYGVGMIDAAAIRDADDRIDGWGRAKHVAALVGTVSHCHGALGVLEIS